MIKKNALLGLLVLALTLLSAGAGWAVDVGSVAAWNNAWNDVNSDWISGVLEVRLTSDFTLPAGPFDVSKDVRITGDSHTITVTGSAVAFNVNKSTGKLTLNGLTLTGGSGALVNVEDQGTLTTSGTTTFSQNTAASGAVSISSGKATFGGTTTFSENTLALNVAGDAEVTFNGGGFNKNAKAVSVAGTGKATFTGVSFAENTGVPAVSVAGTPAEVNFINGSFSKNAGAVNVAFTGNGKTTFDGVSFVENITARAVSITSGAVDFKGITLFEKNTAGALSLAIHPNFIGTSYKFSSNYAADSGGAIVSTFNTPPLVLDGAFEFTNNSADIDGGAVSGVAVTVSGAKFEGNTAKGNGGAIHASGTVTVNAGSSFLNNGKTNGTGTATTANGGAIYAVGDVIVNAGNPVPAFTNNITTKKGGAIFAGVNVTVHAGTFTGNTATGTDPDADGGGAIYASGNVKVEAGSFINNGKTNGTGNATTRNGGAIYAMDGIDIGPSGTSLTFDNNSTINNGGALYSKTTITAENAVFTRNTTLGGSGVDSSGGASYSIGTSDFTNCVFGGSPSTKNSAVTSGGAVYCGRLISKNNTFTDNTVQSWGGAVFINTSSEESTIDNTLFQTNRAANQGGAVYTYGGLHRLDVTTSIFDGNTAGKDGGAIHFDGAHLRLNRSTFTSNTLSSTGPEGGAVWVNAAEFQAINSTFWNNAATAGRGGALYLGTSVHNTGTISDPRSVILYSTFAKNQVGASGQGGSLYVGINSNNRINIAASVFVGTGTNADAGRGRDIFRNSGTIYSDGYNILGDYGITGTGGTPTPSQWEVDDHVAGKNRTHDLSDTSYQWSPFTPPFTQAILFGDTPVWEGAPDPADAVLVGSNLEPTLQKELQAIRLNTASPAIDFIRESDGPGLYSDYLASNFIDQRGGSRPQPYPDGKADSGAYESPNGGGSVTPPSGSTIREVKMSEIPNSLTKIGQTATLRALVIYRNGTSSYSEEVTWASSNQNIVYIDPKYGNIVSLQSSRGQPIKITVTTVGFNDENKQVSDSATLIVSDEYGDNNIHPDIWREMFYFNTSIQDYAESITFTGHDATSGFDSMFGSIYGLTPEQVKIQSVSDILFNYAQTHTSGNWKSAKPSISVWLNAKHPGGGAFLPLRYTWSLDWSEVSEILGRNVRSLSSLQELFGHMKILFEPQAGAAYTVVDAESTGVLSFVSGNHGVTMTLDVLICDVKPYGSGTASNYLVAAEGGAPKLIGDKLTVADGQPDGTIAGSMWLLKSASSEGSGDGDGRYGGGGEGSGGGCDVGFGALAIFALASAALVRIGKR
ncbi:hypothetical protein FACS1894204_11640 [Synergistales bacterium]|nr:hypothetical protein FACS1894204_11640 [Synergistales bacterium]